MKLLKVNDELHRELKTLASTQGKQIQDVTNEAISQHLHKTTTQGK